MPLRRERRRSVTPPAPAPTSWTRVETPEFLDTVHSPIRSAAAGTAEASARASHTRGRPRVEAAAAEGAADRSRAALLRYPSVMQHAAAGIAIVTLEGVLVDVNPALCAIYDCEREELVGASIPPLVAPEDRARVAERIQRLLDGSDEQSIEDVRLARKDGAHCEALVSASVIRASDGRPQEIMAVISDVTERNASARALRRHGEQQTAIARLGQSLTAADSSEQAIAETARALADTLPMPACALIGARAQASGWSVRGEAGSRGAMLLQCRPGRSLVASTLRTGEVVVVQDVAEASGAWAHRLAATTTRSFAIIPCSDAGQSGVAVLEADVPNAFPEDAVAFVETCLRMCAAVVGRRRSEAGARLAAQHDALTGLPNRSFFASEVERALGSAGWPPDPLAVLFLDLDGFKEVNDAYGHAAGDDLLRHVARRLRKAVRPDDFVARFGGDEFVVLCRKVGSPDQAKELAERLLRDLCVEVRVGAARYAVSLSIGVAHYGSGACSADRLIADADTAMYRAKRDGRGRAQLFDIAQRRQVIDRLNVNADLAAGVERNQLVAVYQPIVALDDGTMHGCEALVRWQHPTRGLLMPDSFIGYAEESGAIAKIGAWMLAAAVRQSESWVDGHNQRLSVSVNVSVQELLDPDFASNVERTMSEAHMPRGGLVLELTESAFMVNTDGLATTMLELRQAGAAISIDDFGTGYSSLARLGRMPLDYVKIDRAFVSDMLENMVNYRLVRTIVDMTHALGAKAVAEGVETAAVADELRALGCDFGQGYLWSRPVSAETVATLLEKPSLEPASRISEAA